MKKLPDGPLPRPCLSVHKIYDFLVYRESRNGEEGHNEGQGPDSRDAGLISTPKNGVNILFSVIFMTDNTFLALE